MRPEALPLWSGTPESHAEKGTWRFFGQARDLALHDFSRTDGVSIGTRLLSADGVLTAALAKGETVRIVSGGKNG